MWTKLGDLKHACLVARFSDTGRAIGGLSNAMRKAPSSHPMTVTLRVSQSLWSILSSRFGTTDSTLAHGPMLGQSAAVGGRVLCDSSGSTLSRVEGALREASGRWDWVGGRPPACIRPGTRVAATAG